VYAGCVIWPLHLSPTIGWAAGGLVALVILIQYIVGLTRRLKPSTTADS
jgi:hypothetical protein